MSVKVTTYESLDDRIAPEAITADLGKGLDIVDGHAVKAPGDYPQVCGDKGTHPRNRQ